MDGELKAGWMTKQGKLVKNWKKRWFVLNANALHYSTKPKGEHKGTIDITAGSTVKREDRLGDKKKDGLSITSKKRTFSMYPEESGELEDWIRAISDAIKAIGSGPTSSPHSSIDRSASPAPTQQPLQNSGSSSSLAAEDKARAASYTLPPPEPLTSAAVAALTARKPSTVALPPRETNMENQPRQRLRKARDLLAFSKDPDSTAAIFWNTWLENAPLGGSSVGGAMAFQLVLSVAGDFATLKAQGPQGACIEAFVEFYEKYGTPEEEIDKINELGPRARPTAIGTSLTLSASSPSFGWYFPAEVALEVALDAAGRSETGISWLRWANSQSIPFVNVLAKDLKAHSSAQRNTDFKFTLPGSTPQDQLLCSSTLFVAFDVPFFAQNILDTINHFEWAPTLQQTITLAPDGIAKLGVLFQHPNLAQIHALAAVCKIDSTKIDAIANSIDVLEANDVSNSHWLELIFVHRALDATLTEGLHLALHFAVGTEGSD